MRNFEIITAAKVSVTNAFTLKFIQFVLSEKRFYHSMRIRHWVDGAASLGLLRWQTIVKKCEILCFYKKDKSQFSRLKMEADLKTL